MYKGVYLIFTVLLGKLGYLGIDDIFTKHGY